MRRFLLYFLMTVLVLLVGSLYYAQRPYLSEKEFPKQAVVTFSQAELRPRPEALTVVSYNIGFASGKKNNQGELLSRTEVEANLQEIASALRSVDADLIALQEVDFRAQRTGDIDQFRYLAEALKMPYGSYVQTWNLNYLPWPYWPPSSHYGHLVSGQAILSKFPLTDQQLTTLPKPATKPFWYNWFYLERILQRNQVRWSDAQLDFWNIHLEAFDSKSRLEQAKILAAQLRQSTKDGPVLAGDFNAISIAKPDLKPERATGMTDDRQTLDAIIQAANLNSDPADLSRLTMPSWDPEIKIDHIFFPKDWELIDSGVLTRVGGSDHLAVWVQIKPR